MRESSWDLANPTGRGAVMARYSQCDGPGRSTQGSKVTSLPQKTTQQGDIGRPHDRRGGGLATGTDQDRTKRCFPDRFAGQFGRAAQVFEIDLAESHKAQAHVLPGYRPVDCEQRCGSALLL